MVIKVTNAIIEENLSRFRNKETTQYGARKSVENISHFLAGEVSNLLSTHQIDIDTPLGVAQGIVLEEQIEIVPIMRAGLAMVNSFSEFFPEAHIGFVACERHHDLSVGLLYEKVSRSLKNKTVIILDPMLATGSTIETVINLLESRHPRRIIVVSILAVQMGIKKLLEKGNYTIVTVRDDESLDDNYYIYPGVGDSGDRLFGKI